MISAICPKCNASFELDDEFGGMTVQCGVCNNEFTVAGTAPAASAVPQNIEVVCPGCRTTHQVPGEARGAEAECMVCQVSFRIPEAGNQGILVGSPPAIVPVPAVVPGRPSPFAAATPAPAVSAGSSGISAASGIDYKNTSTIRLTRSSLLGAGGAKPASPFGSGLIPPPPPPKAAPVPAASPAPVPVAAPPLVPVAAPEVAAPATPVSPKSTQSGHIHGKKMMTSARPGKPVGKMAAAEASNDEPFTNIPAKSVVVQNDGISVLDLVLALVPVLLVPVSVMLVNPLGAGVAAGVGGGLALLVWLGILFRRMTVRSK